MKIIVLATALAALAAACGGRQDVVGVGEDEPLIQIVSEGGFVPVEFALGNGPRYTITGDGRVIYQGAQIAIFPGPLLPPYFVAQLSDDQLAALIAMVEDIGLPDMVDETDDSANQFVADASTERITYWDEDGAHRYSVYALGLDPDTPSERNAAFLELIETLDRFTASAEAEPYEGERVRVIAGPGFVDDVSPDTRPWPLDEEWESWTELPNSWVCRVFETGVLEAFGDATSATVWEMPDVFSFPSPAKLIVRPLHPGEPDCPGA